ncbi:MAG: hypothetical protein RLZZ624_238 [Cyanobacteriota bacterium]|jgi:nucleoside-diphosphate-sugar epimerase
MPAQAVNPALAALADRLAQLPAWQRPEGVLILGGGYSGLRLGRALAAAGIPVQLTHRTRLRQRDGRTISVTVKAPEYAGMLRWLPFDGEPNALDRLVNPDTITHLLSTIPPAGNGDDPALAVLGQALEQLPLRWVGYLSTTGVYGDQQGGWVDEATDTSRCRQRSQARVLSETAWQSRGWPLQRFRLPGIYGPGRCPFTNLRQGRARLIHKPGQVFSRIHVDDIAGAVLHNLRLSPEQRPAVLNVADNAPCPSSETLAYAAHLLELSLPPYERLEAVADSLSPMARSFWEENRRVSNRLLCDGLGYRLIHPTYREGFRASLAEEQSDEAAGRDQGRGQSSGLPASAGPARS